MYGALQKVFKRIGTVATSRHGTRRFRPKVEALEDRTAMSYNPASVTYGDQLHVLSTTQGGWLQDHYWDGSWHTVHMGTPSPGVGLHRKVPAPIVHGDKFHVLITGSDGDLYDYSWNTSSSPTSGHWEERTMDAGHPNCEFTGTPSPINYGGVLHVFVTADNGRVYDDIYNRFVYTGVFWQWNDTGWCDATGNPAAISYNNALHVYVAGASGNLYDNWTADPIGLPGAVWHHDNHGNGGAHLTGQQPSAVVYNGNLHVFVIGRNDGNLYDHWWDGGRWHFDNHRNGGAALTWWGTPAPVVYGGTLHVFAHGLDGNLYDHYWDGAAWHFDNHGRGGGTYGFEGSPSVIVYHGDLHVFVSTKRAYTYGVVTELWDHYWNGSWHWDNHYC